MPSKASNRAMAARKQGRMKKHQGEAFQSLQSPPIPRPCCAAPSAAPSLSTPLASVETFS